MQRPDTFHEVDAVTNADEITRLSCSEALRSTGRELKLFTPALLITHGGFDRDPVLEFDARFPASSKELRPFAIDLTRDAERFFSGLGVTKAPGTKQLVNWDKRLYAIDESRAEECFGFIGGIAFSAPKRGFFANVMSYDLNIADPTSIDNDRLIVKVFGVMSNQFDAFLQPRPTAEPIARVVHMGGRSSFPANLPRTNLIGIRPDEDPLNMRED